MASESIRTTTAMASAYLRGVRRRFRDGASQSRLMTVTLFVFLAVYLTGGFLLFSLGLFYLDRLPLLGGILVERVLYLIFFFFFLMLVFSNAVISYLSLFRSRETQWLLGLPISIRSLLLWKVTETLVISSWGLLFMSAPIFAAYAYLGGASMWFYPKAIVTLVLFVGIPACVGTWILLLLVRFYDRNWKWLALAVLAAMLVSYGLSHDPITSIDEEAQVDVATGLNQVLRHTELSVHPLLPSSWMSDATFFWSRGEETRGWFFALLLSSYAFMGLWVTTMVASRLYLPAWNSSVRRGAVGRHRHKNLPQLLEREFSGRRQGIWAALTRKDAISFRRDAGQYGQFLVVFGLLFLYAFNLRHLGYDFDNPRWKTVISYLNLTVCSLALSTLTTRFVYPQFSLEGRRLWLLGVAPMGLHQLLWQKIVVSTLLVGVAMVGLMLISGQQLDLNQAQTILFVAGIATMSVGLSTLAVSLGTLFPNMKESNPAKVVSGTGGTLCLILSFVYIVGAVLLLLHPAIVSITQRGLWAGQNYTEAAVVALVGLALWTLLLAGSSAFFAYRQVKTLAILSKM